MPVPIEEEIEMFLIYGPFCPKGFMSCMVLIIISRFSANFASPKDNFPKINLILGSHEPHQTDKELKCEIVNMLTERKKCMIP